MGLLHRSNRISPMQQALQNLAHRIPRRTPESAAATTVETARDALCEAVRLLDGAEQQMRPAEMCQALAQVARCHRDLGAVGQAEWFLQRALRWAGTLGAADSAVELLCDLAEVAVLQALAAAGDDEPRRAHAALERARDHCFAA